MGFYFCSGIFLCFMCVITLPIFSTGKPCLDEEMICNKSIQIVDPSKYFNKDDILREKENPIAFYRAQLNVNKYKKYEWKDVNTYRRIFEMEFSRLKQVEDDLYEQFRKVDTENNNTVSRSNAMNVISTSTFFDSLNYENRSIIVDRFINNEYKFDYKKMKNNIINIYDFDKSSIYFYDAETDDWVNK
ncbi:uncharacterized protein LOC126905659 [Daktulosphaira vitifoliae]|uniref:uncharacterized protein LOC126905659 n=1 Tax=Daktulosphaira vitifoliae TaxID=58002 RepID=UPI0021AAF458|nr:uncharacterized protein LOC126905659 [Daktulosphaira vitifoliae]